MPMRRQKARKYMNIGRLLEVSYLYAFSLKRSAKVKWILLGVEGKFIHGISISPVPAIGWIEENSVDVRKLYYSITLIAAKPP